MIGQTVSHYRITKQLGAGGMGIVYEATDLKLDRPVALKFLPPELTRDNQARLRFAHEAKAASALDHPNICTIYEIGETDDGQSFIAMACYEGETLAERISRGPLPLDLAISIARSIASGLVKAHDRGIVHRDIKPANIFITSDGMVKILDFGLAKLASAPRITHAGSTLGTATYMSPEQARGEEADHRADLWCLGSVLYEMVTGRPPFQGADNQSVIHSILNDEPRLPTAMRTGVPLELERQIARCLEKDPRARYQTAADLESDLGRVSGSALDPTLAMARPGHTPRRESRVGLVFAVVVILGIVFVGLNFSRLRERWVGGGGDTEIRSLVVLPFGNMMGDTEQDFFVEGLHESLITELSKLESLRVISRTTAMYYRTTDKSIPEISKELSVDAVVEGSVLRVGDRVRITAQLIRGASDEHLWAEDYDRELRDILNLLSEVAQSVAEEIDIALTPQQRERLATSRTVDPDVYELHLKGLHHLYEFTEQDAIMARRYFERAIEADPEFGLAYAGLAGALIVYSIVGDLPPRDLFPPARDAARRALELDPDVAVAHTVLGFVELYFNWDRAAAEKEFRLALDINPNDGDALHGLASVLIFRAEFDEAVDLVEHARKYDPYSYLRNLPVWVNLVIAHRYEEAIADIDRWRAFSEVDQLGWYWRCVAAFQLGRHEVAMSEMRHTTSTSDSGYSVALEQAYAESGMEGAFRVRGEHLANESRDKADDPISIALYFALAGDTDKALFWLERVYEERIPTVHMLAQPALDPYRSDPRFAELLTKIGFVGPRWQQRGD